MPATKEKLQKNKSVQPSDSAVQQCKCCDDKGGWPVGSKRTCVSGGRGEESRKLQLSPQRLTAPSPRSWREPDPSEPTRDQCTLDIQITETTLSQETHLWRRFSSVSRGASQASLEALFKRLWKRLWRRFKQVPNHRWRRLSLIESARQSSW